MKKHRHCINISVLFLIGVTFAITLIRCSPIATSLSKLPIKTGISAPSTSDKTASTPVTTSNPTANSVNQATSTASDLTLHPKLLNRTAFGELQPKGAVVILDEAQVRELRKSRRVLVALPIAPNAESSIYFELTDQDADMPAETEQSPSASIQLLSHLDRISADTWRIKVAAQLSQPKSDTSQTTKGTDTDKLDQYLDTPLAHLRNVIIVFPQTGPTNASTASREE